MAKGRRPEQDWKIIDRLDRVSGAKLARGNGDPEQHCRLVVIVCHVTPRRAGASNL